ncbi:MAG: type II toxin-antitoxin system RelE/ParE family toxin, partial [Bacteroidaceae bacterium]|nr:type II toxin-antitoxin system RelE/ParE family toxin [Bacteroidaceae bacterium]
PRIYGSRYEEVAEDLYGYRANKHIIFYRILPNDDILVIRILHQKMDLKHHLTDGSN